MRCIGPGTPITMRGPIMPVLVMIAILGLGLGTHVGAEISNGIVIKVAIHSVVVVLFGTSDSGAVEVAVVDIWDAGQINLPHLIRILRVTQCGQDLGQGVTVILELLMNTMILTLMYIYTG